MKTLTRIQMAALPTLWVASISSAQTNPNQIQPRANSTGQQDATPSQPAQSQALPDISQTPWFNSPGIRQELQLKDKQFQTLNENYQRAWNRYHEGASKLAPTLTSEQRQLQLTELTNQFRKDFARGLDAVISTPSDRQRYHQLDWQYRGYGAFDDPAVVDKLNLSDAQRRKFDQFGRDWHHQFNNWRRSYPQNQQRVGRQLEEGRRQMWDDINATLTPEQREKWRQMTGERYEFEPDAFFPNESASNTTLKPPLP